MTNSKGLSSILILLIIFTLIIILLFIFNFIKLPSEFFSAFAGAFVALIFSATLSFIFWQRGKKLSKSTKAQIIQTLLNEIELNLNNIVSFVQGCREGTHFLPFMTSQQQKFNFWPRFLTDYPHPSFELTQDVELIYGSFFLIEYSAKELQRSLPEEIRAFHPPGLPLPEVLKQQIISDSSGRQQGWRFTINSMIGYYDKIIEILSKDYKGYKFKKQPYFKDNKTYEKLKRFSTEI